MRTMRAKVNPGCETLLHPLLRNFKNRSEMVAGTCD